MSVPTVHIQKLDAVDWPAPDVYPADRVISGAPEASTLVMSESEGVQMGMWRVTPGAFTTDHAGYIEFITVLSGVGRLVREDGEVTELAPGTTAVMEAGWVGRWEIDEEFTKAYTIVHVS